MGNLVSWGLGVKALTVIVSEELQVETYHQPGYESVSQNLFKNHQNISKMLQNLKV